MEDVFKVKQEGTTLMVHLGMEMSVENTPALKEKLMEYQGQDIEKIVFDATDLLYISSSGVRLLVFAQQKIGHSPKMELLNCDKKIYETLDIVGMTQFFSFTEDDRINMQAATPNQAVTEWKKRVTEAKQKMLDHFAAHNDVVVYQMKLEQEDKE